MTDTTTAVNEQAQELDEFDVEGHGIKDVAALGLSAATIVAGGAGAASLALDNPLPGTTSGIAAAVAGVQGDLDRTEAGAGGIASEAVRDAGVKVGDVQRFADRTGTFAVVTAQPVIDRTGQIADDATDLADSTVASSLDLARDLVADPIGTTDSAVDGAMGDVRDVRDDALATARSTASTTVTVADRTATEALKTAGDTAKTATTTATTTAEKAYDAVDPSVDVSESDSGSTVTVEAADKRVSVETG